jgi:hypothetical protein
MRASQQQPANVSCGRRSFTAVFPIPAWNLSPKIAGYCYEPFWLHSSEIGTNMIFEREFWIKNNGSIRFSPKNHPMPEGVVPFTVPFNGQEG